MSFDIIILSIQAPDETISFKAAVGFVMLTSAGEKYAGTFTFVAVEFALRVILLNSSSTFGNS